MSMEERPATKPTAKKEYSPPKLTVHGKLEELTQGPDLNQLSP